MSSYKCLNAANGVKGCSKCGEIRSQSEFRKNKNRSDGLNGGCKVCLSKVQQEDRKNGMPERERRYRYSSKGQKVQKKAVDNYRKTEKYRDSWKNSNEKYKISRSMSANIRESIIDKNGKGWEALVDFTYEELVDHLESLFEEGMTGENHGEGHIDHVRPISGFTFESVDDPEFKECGCLENLQPLWKEDNIRKSNKWEG